VEPLKRIRYLRADDKKSLLPDPAANEFGPIRKVIAVIAEKIRSEIPPADIGEVMEDVEQILDRSVSTEGYVIRPSATSQNYVDLSRIDFEALKAKFENGRKPIEAQKLRGKIAQGVISVRWCALFHYWAFFLASAVALSWIGQLANRRKTVSSSFVCASQSAENKLRLTTTLQWQLRELCARRKKDG